MDENASPPPPPETVGIASGERPLAWLAFAWSFLTMCVFYSLTPLRSGFLLAHVGPQALPWVYVLSAAATGAAVWVYARMAGSPRGRFIPGVILTLSVNLLVWAGLVAAFGTQSPWLSFPFYLWVDVFGIMSVTLMWTYLNDIFTGEGAKRYFSLIASAGSLGAIAGSLFIKQGVRAIGPVWTLLIAAAVYAAVLGVFALMERRARAASLGKASLSRGKDLGKFSSAIKAIVSSRYLFLVTVVACLERFVPDLAEYTFGVMGKAFYPDEKALTVFSATFSLYEGCAAVLIGVLLGSFVVKRIGVKGALLSAPLADLVGFAAFLLSPIFPIVVVHNALDGLFRHTIFKGGKEAVWNLADRETVYKVKAYIEMFFYRFSRAVAGLSLLLLTAVLGLGTAGVAVAGALFAALWVWSAWQLGNEANAREAAADKS